MCYIVSLIYVLSKFAVLCFKKLQQQELIVIPVIRGGEDCQHLTDIDRDGVTACHNISISTHQHQHQHQQHSLTPRVYSMKTQEMPLVGGFGYLELCLYVA